MAKDTINLLRLPDYCYNLHLNNPVYQFTRWNFTTGRILNFLMITGGVIALFIFKAVDKREQETEVKQAKEHVGRRKLKKRIK